MNPCAEEPLPAGGSCLLGSINLSEFVVNPFSVGASFDFDGFKLCGMIGFAGLFCHRTMTLDYRQRIDMQAVWQTHIDASISSTVNVPGQFTVEEKEQKGAVAGPKAVRNINQKLICPECGEALVFEGGCNLCKCCGWSKCL